MEDKRLDSPDMHVITIPIANIDASNIRQRKDLGNTLSLQLSIETHGLLCPIIVEEIKDTDRYRLIAGERRLTTCTKLDWEKIPAILKKNLDELTRQELELEENITRKQLNFMEEARAIAKIDKLRKQKFGAGLPGMFSRTGWTQQDTAKELGLSVGKVSQHIKLAEALEEYPELKKCTNVKEALKLIRKLEENQDSQWKNDKTLNSMKESFVNFSMTELFSTVENSTVDLLVLDLMDDVYDNHFESSYRCLSLTGQGFLFFNMVDLSKVLDKLKQYQFNYIDKPLMWHIKAKDDYISYIWFSKGLVQPTGVLSKHISLSLDLDCLHSQARPYKLYHSLVASSSNKNGFVLEPKAFGLNLAKVCKDLGRNCLIGCPNISLRDQCFLKLSRS